MASKWEDANLNSTPFDDLPIALIKEWIEDDNKVSIYVIDDLDKLPEIAMGLTMVAGLGPKGGQFFVLEFDHLKAAKLQVHQTNGHTKCPSIDRLHYDITLQKGVDVRNLIEAFVSFGEVRTADQIKVRARAIDALRAGDYGLPDLVSKLKDPPASNEVQKVCNSTIRLIGSGDLTLT